MKDDFNGHGVMSNDDSERLNISSLLTSKDRDFLLSANGNQVKVSGLKEKVIGLYFSANWYPPCRSFNKVLVDTYLELKKKNSNFEIVYVSSDEDAEAFDAYRSEMPWLSIPFSDLGTKKSLSRRFDIEDIPWLVILQPNNGHKNNCKDEARTVCDGVELVYRHGVEAFPFTAQRLEQLQREENERHENQTLVNLLTNSHRDFLLGHPRPNKMTSVSSLAGKTIGLYFSAQWCLPCVKFTPRLVSIYHKIKQALTVDRDDFEIVFVSSDHDQTSFDSYFSSMPWLSIPFRDPNLKALAKHFDVKAIPSLVILGPDGKTVTLNGRNLINLYQENCYPFTKGRIGMLEKELDEEAKSLPTTVTHAGHRHQLSLVSDGNGGGPFVCCDCDEQGSTWVYLCLECGYEIHPKCVKT